MWLKCVQYRTKFIVCLYEAEMDPRNIAPDRKHGRKSQQIFANRKFHKLKKASFSVSSDADFTKVLQELANRSST